MHGERDDCSCRCDNRQGRRHWTYPMRDVNRRACLVHKPGEPRHVLLVATHTPPQRSCHIEIGGASSQLRLQPLPLDEQQRIFLHGRPELVARRERHPAQLLGHLPQVFGQFKRRAPPVRAEPCNLLRPGHGLSGELVQCCLALRRPAGPAVGRGLGSGLRRRGKSSQCLHQPAGRSLGRRCHPAMEPAINLRSRLGLVRRRLASPSPAPVKCPAAMSRTVQIFAIRRNIVRWRMAAPAMP